MKITPSLVSWQRSNYPSAHGHRANLALHILTAPLLVGGELALIFNLIHGSARHGLRLWVLGFLAALVFQGIGHRLEDKAPDPFLSPLDFLARILVENNFNFWRFVFSGDFLKSWRGEAPKAPLAL